MYYVRSHVTKYFHIFFPDISYFYQAVRERYERGEGGREGERERELVGGVLGDLLEVLLPTALVALEHLQEEIYRSC